jgi:hypothetical protein
MTNGNVLHVYPKFCLWLEVRLYVAWPSFVLGV